MLLIVTVLVVVSLLLLILYRKNKKKKVTQADLPPPPCLNVASTTELPEPTSNCVLSPINGTCLSSDTRLENGCCVLDLPPELSKKRFYTELILGIAGVVVAGEIAESTVTAPAQLLLWINKRAATQKAGKKGLSGFITKMCQKVMARKTAQLAVKMTAKLGRAANIASAVLAAVDIADPYGYSTFISNKYLEDIRDTVEYYIEISCKEIGERYPMMFDIMWLFGKQYDEAYIQYIISFVQAATSAYMSCSDAVIDDDTFGEIVMIAIEKGNENPLKRDLFIYEKMKFLYPDIQDYIALYTSMPTENNTGISISSTGLTYYNTLTREQKIEKIKEATFFLEPLYVDDKVVNGLMEYLDTCVIAMAKEYRKHDVNSGCREPYREVVDHIMRIGTGFRDDCVPNMITHQLDTDIPMIIPNVIKNMCETGGPLLVPGVPACETWDPTEYNVGFNPNRNLCIYTPEYCDRMALDYDSSTQDCKWYPGQEGVELFSPTGTTLTRNVMRYGTTIDNCNNPEFAKDYENVHDCRAQNISGISTSIEKLDSLKECDENWQESGYRSKEACEFARTGSFITTAVPFSTNLFFDCGDGLLKTFVNEAYDLGEGTKELFEGNPRYFEEKSEGQKEAFENRGNAMKKIFTSGGSEQDYITAFTGSKDPNSMANIAYKQVIDSQRRQFEQDRAFFTGEADYNNPLTWIDAGAVFLGGTGDVIRNIF